jgi:hypothetical protein
VVGFDVIDNVVWQALTVVLTLLGLAGSALLWRRRGAASGLRMLGVALLPAAAYLTGTLRLIWEITDSVVSWAVRFAFSPFVWAGIALAGVAAVLIAVSSAMRARGVGTSSRASTADASRRSETALPRGPSRPPARPDRAGRGEGDEDLADIEAILKRHGIS